MNIKRPWVVAGTTLALAGFGTAVAVAGADVPLNDSQPAPVVQMAGERPPAPAPVAPAVDNSPESADSPTESPFESANSPYDSPGEAPDPSPESPDSPNQSPVDSADSTDSPAASVDSP